MSYDNRPACHRCGRTSHMVRDCYAKTHINGTQLQGQGQGRPPPRR